MKLKLILSGLAVICCSNLNFKAQTSPTEYLLPIPNSVQSFKGNLDISKIKSFKAPALPDSEWQPIAREMTAFFAQELSQNLTKANKASIYFNLNKNLKNPEAYRLEISPKKISITARESAGLYYGWKSLQQMLSYAKLNHESALPAVKIYDSPRLGFRALMLDPARHFLPVKAVKKYIDAMAFYKYNYLHLHLTDDQGWRVEIKAYPELTQKGALVKQADGSMKPLFYTQEELKELVQYAQQRFIEIIPEVDIPGHNTAFLTAFPELACFPNPNIQLRTTPGVSKDILCASNPKVYTIYAQIFNELSEIFPSKYFHLGGDEAPLVTWEKSEACQRMIKEKGLKDVHGLMSYFLQKNADVLIQLGKTPLFWYELDIPKYPEGSIAYFWRMGLSKKVIEKAAAKGYQLIGAPGEHAYFDYAQSRNDELARRTPVATLPQVYQFNPTYDFDTTISNHVMGIEATLWGEYIPDINRAFYQTFPRALAFAEVGWSQQEDRSWEDFKKRMLPHLSFLLEKGINYRPPYEVFSE